MIDRHSAEHYIWKDLAGAECDGWHLVRQPGMSVILERMPPGTSERRHYHTTARQFFFVLRGKLTIEIDETETAGGGGTLSLLHNEQGIEVEPGKIHQVRNTSEEETLFLVISSPPSHGDRINEENETTG